MRNANVIDFIFEPFFENNISKTLEKNSLFKDTFESISPNYNVSLNEKECQLRINLPAVNRETLKVETDPFDLKVTVDAEIQYESIEDEKVKPVKWKKTFYVDKIWDIENPHMVRYKDGVLYIRFRKKEKYINKQISVQF